MESVDDPEACILQPSLPQFREIGIHFRVFSNIFALEDFVGVADAKVLSRYVETDWREYRERLLRI